jgi:8-oxo-dGTP pyrophosphatase MutT (NUDIX family)
MVNDGAREEKRGDVAGIASCGTMIDFPSDAFPLHFLAFGGCPVTAHSAGPDELAAELATALHAPFAMDEPLLDALTRRAAPTELAARCRAALLRQAERVGDERAYALTRLLHHRLTDGAPDERLTPVLGRVETADRTRLIRERTATARTAAVAVPLVQLPGIGLAFAVTRRSSVNGYTGGPMTNAGEVVLFGGATEPGEPAAVTAVRELLEEAGLKSPDGPDGGLDPRFDPFEEISAWTTEAGFEVRGFLVNAPAELPELLDPDLREVADVGFVSVAALYAAEPRTVYHPLCGIDRDRRPLFVGEFASPTCDVPDVDGRRRWELWGLAGHMLQVVRDRYPSAASLAAASERRRALPRAAEEAGARD